MASLKQDLAFGETSEQTNQRALEVFFNKTLIRRGGYAPFDYDDGATFYVELKTRRIPHDMYPTAIIGGNKVDTAAANPNRTYWFCYAYNDGIYGIQYDKDVFDTFSRSEYARGERSDYHNRPQECVFIPHTSLKRIA